MVATSALRRRVLGSQLLYRCGLPLAQTRHALDSGVLPNGERRVRIFGVPNSVVGQLFYLALATAGLTGGLDQSVARLLLTGVSGVAVLLGAYLTYALLVVLRVHCILCYTSHAINLTLLALLVATS